MLRQKPPPPPPPLPPPLDPPPPEPDELGLDAIVLLAADDNALILDENAEAWNWPVPVPVYPPV